MPSTVLLDIAGRRRSPATLPAFHAGRPPHNKGLRHPADPPSVEEIIPVMHAAGGDAEGVRLRGLSLLRRRRFTGSSPWSVGRRGERVRVW
jgi:hypothetical protein